MIKRLTTAIILVLANLIVSSQGIQITSGGHIVASGSANIVVNNGSLQNNGTYTKDAEMFYFTGGIAGTITGDNTSINHLIISNTAGITSSLSLLTAQTLDISSSCKLTVTAAKALTVNGALTNGGGTGGLVLKSTSAGTASLLHTTSSIPATVERYIPSSAEAWHFMTTPVSAQNISGEWLPSGTYGNSTGYDLYVWHEPSSCWIYKLNTTAAVNWNTIHPESNFVLARGYLYAFQATNPTKIFTGNLNCGSISTNLSYSSSNATLKGFNFIGNPYPSSIDWHSSTGWFRSSLANSGDGYDMWIWNPAVNNYGVYNSADADGVGTNSVTRYIASMQGFFVKASSNGVFEFDNAVRVHDGSNVFKTKESKRNVLSLTVKSEAGFGADEVLLRFGYTQNANGASKLFSKVESAPSLYMNIEKEYFSTLHLTTPDLNASIPVMFTPGASGYYSIGCNFDLFRFNYLKLEDRLSHTIYDLTSENPYRFKATKGDYPNRFVLHFTPNMGTPKEQLPARVYAFDQKLIVDLELVEGETTIEAYDLLGCKIMQRKVQGNVKHNLDLDVKAGVIIVVIRNQEKTLKQKVMWMR